MADNRGGELITPLAFAGTNNAYLLTSFNSRVQICTAPYILPAFFIPSQTVTGDAMRLKGSPTLVNRVYTLDDSQPSLYRSDDSGNTFTAIDSGIDYAFPGFPTDIAESRTNTQDIVVTLAGANPSFDRVVRSTNGGSTWSDISGDLPMIRVNAVARDPHDTSTYYVGTDIGCFMTQNGGINWFNLNALGLPNAIVTDLVINAGQNTLFAATFGRGIWKIPLSNVRVNTLSLNRNKLYPNEDATLTITLNQAASPGTVVGLLDNSSALTTPALVTVPNRQTSTTALVEANDVTTTTVVTITAAISGETKTISLTVYPYQTVSNLTFSPSPVSGGQPTTGTVTLAANAPKDTNVRISSSASSVQLPLTVTVPSGQRTKTFTMNTNVVNADETVTIEANQTGSSTAFSRNLTIWQPTTPISHTVSPPSVTGGASATARVTLVRPAPSGGTTVTLSSNQAKVNVPGSILIASGATSRTYQVTTQSTTVTVFASLSATANGVTRTATLTLRP